MAMGDVMPPPMPTKKAAQALATSLIRRAKNLAPDDVELQKEICRSMQGLIADLRTLYSKSVLNFYRLAFINEQTLNYTRHPLDGHPDFKEWKGFWQEGMEYQRGDFVELTDECDGTIWRAEGKTTSKPGKNTAWRVRFRVWRNGITCQPDERVMLSSLTEVQMWICKRATSEAPHHGDSWQLAYKQAKAKA
jgi:hypothetical protein